MDSREQNRPVVSRAQASAAGLFVAFLFFGIAVAGFIALNRYWPVVGTMVPPPSAELGGSDTDK